MSWLSWSQFNDPRQADGYVTRNVAEIAIVIE
jgi:hypothetical protein